MVHSFFQVRNDRNRAICGHEWTYMKQIEPDYPQIPPIYIIGIIFDSQINEFFYLS
jgi:hypothetical protein